VPAFTHDVLVSHWLVMRARARCLVALVPVMPCPSLARPTVHYRPTYALVALALVTIAHHRPSDSGRFVVVGTDLPVSKLQRGQGMEYLPALLMPALVVLVPVLVVPCWGSVLVASAVAGPPAVVARSSGPLIYR
jgi:hypothetical protein